MKSSPLLSPGGGRLPLPPPPPGYQPTGNAKKIVDGALKPYIKEAAALKQQLAEAKEKLADFEAAKTLEPERCSLLQLHRIIVYSVESSYQPLVSKSI